MNRLTLPLFFILYSIISLAHVHSVSTPSYSFTIKDNILTVTTDGTTVYQKTFYHPDGYTTDMDGDNNNEYVVIDSIAAGVDSYFNLYIYNTLDSFYLVDSVLSGDTKPYETASEDVEGILFATGNPAYDKLSSLNDVSFSTLNFWKFVEGSIYLVNSEVYDLYIEGNNEIIQIIDSYIETKGLNCNTSKEILGAVAAVFGNYLSAGEDTLAIKFLKEYYLCADIDQLEQELRNIIM